MILSTKTSLKFSNKNKLEKIDSFINEYRRVVSLFIEILWEMDKVPTLLPNEITSKIETWLSKRVIQCCGKQASGIVRGTKQKQKQRLFVINKLIQNNELKKARKLQKIYDSTITSKPLIDNIECELDSRFVKIDLNNETSFDGWVTLTSLGNKLKIKVTLTSLGNKLKIKVPFKKHSHFNELLSIGKIKNGIRLSKSKITFMFDCIQSNNTSNNVVGIDVGVNSLISIDYGNERKQSQKDIHNHDLNSINEILSRKKKGSKGFVRTQQHRTNYINSQINKLNWNNIGTLRIEKIRNLRRGRKTSRKLQHFNYNEIFDRLKLKSLKHNVRVQEINPTYTSQRCNCCGWTRKSNRKGLQFKCEKCSNEQNSDLNASSNIRLNLREIGNKERSLHKNRIGFYWNELSHEPIVRDV